MSLYETFSKRLMLGKNTAKDVYTYDALPEKLRVQIVCIIKDAVNNLIHEPNAYKEMVEILCRENGQFSLVSNPPKMYGNRLYGREMHEFVLREKDIFKVLDAVELVLRYSLLNIDALQISQDDCRRQKADDLIMELNERFKEHGVGYQFEGNSIIRVDSQFAHAIAIKPTINLIQKKGYESVNKEFMAAFEHFRHGRNASAMNECLKAYESTMKIICSKNNWSHSSSATASTLIDVCINNGLVPVYWLAHFEGLKSVLKSSILTPRNKESAHGAGLETKDIPDYLVSYMINTTASTILFLISANGRLS